MHSVLQFMIEEEAFFSDWFQEKNDILGSLERRLSSDSSDETDANAIQCLQEMARDLYGEDARLTQLCRQIQVAAEKQDKGCQALIELTKRFERQ